MVVVYSKINEYHGKFIIQIFYGMWSKLEIFAIIKKILSKFEKKNILLILIVMSRFSSQLCYTGQENWSLKKGTVSVVTYSSPFMVNRKLTKNTDKWTKKRKCSQKFNRKTTTLIYVGKSCQILTKYSWKVTLVQKR